jgi:hypothetical protein
LVSVDIAQKGRLNRVVDVLIKVVLVNTGRISPKSMYLLSFLYLKEQKGQPQGKV